LQANFKFWIVYLHIIAERLNDFARATLRTRLFGDLETEQQGLFKGNEREILLKEVGSIVEADKLQQINDPAELPVFGGQENPENLQKNETFTDKE
jgi:hypothetical protein